MTPAAATAEAFFENAPEQALAWHRAGEGAVLATVVQTWGSAPRRTGSQLVVRGDGHLEGSVSGGCVEGAVVMEALDALKHGAHRLLEFGVSDADAFSVGLACGGTIKILVEPVGARLTEETLAALVDARRRRQPVAYEVDLETGQGQLTAGPSEAMLRDRSAVREGSTVFVAVHNPPLRLLVVGAVHIAQALVPMARLAGYDPVVIDPRAAFGSQARFPGEQLVEDWPDEALEALGVDSRTALVMLTHDPKLDDPALIYALNSEPPCFYVGALGSTRTHAKRVTRLSEAGISSEQIARIHGPVGLDIGAATPAEIAVSILAEMTAALRGKTR